MHAQVHRAFHAPFKNLSVTCGCVLQSGQRQQEGRVDPDCVWCNGTGREPTKATWVFTKNLLKLLREHKPDYMAVAADNKREDLVRRKWHPGYKAHRGTPDPDLGPQIRRCRQIVNALGIPLITAPGWEADDVIATITDAVMPWAQAVIVGRDKDLMQLIGQNCRMFDPQTDEWLDGRHVHQKYGVYNYQMRDYQALVGDGTDGFPGVKGVGPKGAVELLTKFGNLEAAEVFNEGEQGQPSNAWATFPASLLRTLDLCEKQRKQLKLCRKLATLNRDVELPDLDLEDYRRPEKVSKKAKTIFRMLGFQRWAEE
jgi:DNA polymerase-1